MPPDFKGRVSEGLTVLVDLLNNALVVNDGGIIVPKQGILTALLGVVTYLCQIHAEYKLQEKQQELNELAY